MNNHLKYKLSVFILTFLFNAYSNAQQSNIVYYANNAIAIKKQNDSIYFYNSLGELRKIISLKNNKSTPYGLPKEVQEIIYTGEVPERIAISEETFPTFLYTHKYTDAGIVLCSEQYFYNELGLKTGYIEICPDDTGGANNHSGGKNIYKYNTYGLLTERENTVFKYNDNGQLIERRYRNVSSIYIYSTINYQYQYNKLISAKKNEGSQLNYTYNSNGLLSEIIKNNRHKIAIEYNKQHKVTKVSEVHQWRGKLFKNIRLTYSYDTNNNIEKIETFNAGFLSSTVSITYDIEGNIIQKMFDGKIIGSYKYDKKGTLISIESNKKWGAVKTMINYEFTHYKK